MLNISAGGRTIQKHYHHTGKSHQTQSWCTKKTGNVQFKIKITVTWRQQMLTLYCSTESTNFKNNGKGRLKTIVKNCRYQSFKGFHGFLCPDSIDRNGWLITNQVYLISISNCLFMRLISMISHMVNRSPQGPLLWLIAFSQGFPIPLGKRYAILSNIRIGSLVK